ncbi:MAG: HEAT repeat domain-containing protein [Lentisphaeria bacterium]
MNKAAENMDHLSISLKLGCIFLFLATWNAVGASGTIGVIAIDDQEPARITADLLQDVLTAEDEFQLVERERIEEILTEINLSEAVASPGQRLQLGRITGADFLVLLETLEKEEAHLRVVDCTTGAIVYSTDMSLPGESDPEALLRKVSKTLHQKVKWMSRVSREEVVPVSVPTINCLAPDTVSDQQIARRLRRRLRARLGSMNKIICLERREIKKAKREIEEFQGKAADFWNSSVIVTGTAGLQGKELQELFVALKLRLPDGKEQNLKSVTGESNSLDRIVDTATARIVEQLVSDNRSAPEISEIDRSAEIDYLSQLAEIYYSKSQFRKAQKMMETVFAIQDQPPSKKQCFLMAGIMQDILPNHRSSVGLDKHEEYYNLLERYIYMFENFITPKKWDHSGRKYQVVRRDIGGFLLRFPTYQAEVLKTSSENKEQYEDLERSIERRSHRAERLRKLWREYDLQRNRIGMQSKFIAYWRDFDKICRWYKKHWEKVIDQLVQPATSSSGKPDSETEYFDMERRHSWKKWGYGDPLSKENSERGVFAFEICRRHMRWMPEGCSSELPTKVHKLYAIHYEATVELFNRLSLSSFTKAALWVYLRGPRNSSRSQWGISGRINLPEDKFQKSAKQVIQMLRDHVEKNDSHWIIERVLTDANNQYEEKRGELAKIFWKALHDLPPDDQQEAYNNLFHPLISKHPKSHFASCHSSSLIWFDDKLWMPKTLDKTVLTQAEQWLLTQLLSFYKQAQKKKNLFTAPLQKQMLNRVMKHTEAVYPEIARKIMTRAQDASDQATENISLPVIFPGKLLPEKHPVDFNRYNILVNWKRHKEKLWLLWGGESGYLATAINVKNLSVEKAVPVYLRHNFGNPSHKASVAWAFSSERTLVGIRNYREKVRGIHPFVTDSVEPGLNEKTFRDSFMELIKQAEPVQHVSGRTPVPERAARNITAFCAFKANIYFANSDGIYCWNEQTNELKLLASNQLENDNSPLNGGMAYVVQLMETDYDNSRILFGVRESKNGRSYKLRDSLGPRTGIWAYHAENKTWEKVRKTVFGGLPGRVRTECKNSNLLFTRYFAGSSVSGTMNLQTGKLHYRGNARIAVGDKEKHGGWRWSSPLGKIDFPQTVETYIHHPAKDAWIVYAPGKGNQMYWVEDGKIVQTLTMKNVHVHPNTGELMLTVIPVPEGALIWHLRENDDGKHTVPAFLYWKRKAELEREDVTVDLKGDRSEKDQATSRESKNVEKKPFAEQSFAAVLTALNNGNPEIRKRAVEELGERKDDRAVQPLIEALESFYWFVREKAADALGQVRDSDAIPALTERLKDPYWRVREASARALGNIGDPKTIPDIKQALEDPHDEVCESAIWALADIEHRQAFSILIDSLDHEKDAVRTTAEYAVCRLAEKLANAVVVPRLIDTLTDDTSTVRRTGAKALRQITKHDFGQDADKWKKWWRENRNNNK